MPVDEVLATMLKTMASFRSNVSTLNSGNQASQQVKTEWNNVRALLSEHALPKLGPSVRFGVRTALAAVGTSLKALDHSDAQQAQGMRSVWIANIESQLSELEELIRNPPPDAPVLHSGLPPEATRSDDRTEALATAKALLESGAEAAETRASDLREAAKWAQIIAVVLCLIAAMVPFVWKPDGVGWPLAAQWGTRLLTVLAFLAPALVLIRVSSDHQVRAMTSHRERSLLQVLAASAYMTSSKDHGAALVEFVRNLSQPEKPNETESALVLPATLIKELPVLLKAFKGDAK